MDKTWIILITTILPLIATFGGVGIYYFYELKARKQVNAKVSDQSVIDIARSNAGKINVALLCEHTGVSAYEAKVKLRYLQQNGMLGMDWTGFMSGGPSYILPGSNNLLNPLKNVLSKNEWVKRLGLEDLFGDAGSNTNPKQLEQNLSKHKDALIISLAMENQGVVSASMVCVKLNISIDEAQRKLEELRQKQIFETELSPNGGLLYRLLD
ncbi:MAG TPA: hypothetical protein DCM08_08220 [Microscillaceae bacterium]|jgi:hypothetical protein|nr:hypothetical protein [Microscillaceae bacterium]